MNIFTKVKLFQVEKLAEQNSFLIFTQETNFTETKVCFIYKLLSLYKNKNGTFSLSTKLKKELFLYAQN